MSRAYDSGFVCRAVGSTHLVAPQFIGGLCDYGFSVDNTHGYKMSRANGSIISILQKYIVHRTEYQMLPKDLHTHFEMTFFYGVQPDSECI